MQNAIATAADIMGEEAIQVILVAIGAIGPPRGPVETHDLVAYFFAALFVCLIFYFYGREPKK
jgi:hypothetical protein